MRFGKNIALLAIPEWKQCYLDYEHLKIFIRLIKKIVEIILYCTEHVSEAKRETIDATALLEEDISEGPLHEAIRELLVLGEQVNELFFDAHIKSMGINRLFLHMKLLEMRSYFGKCEAISLLQLEKPEMALLMQIVEFIYI